MRPGVDDLAFIGDVNSRTDGLRKTVTTVLRGITTFAPPYVAVVGHIVNNQRTQIG